jgi:hypothetical protein
MKSSSTWAICRLSLPNLVSSTNSRIGQCNGPVLISFVSGSHDRADKRGRISVYLPGTQLRTSSAAARGFFFFGAKTGFLGCSVAKLVLSSTSRARGRLLALRRRQFCIPGGMKSFDKSERQKLGMRWRILGMDERRNKDFKYYYVCTANAVVCATSSAVTCSSRAHALP